MFISTLALTKLEQNRQEFSQQEQLLIASMYPIVSFIVLCSILVRKPILPVPFIVARDLTFITLTYTNDKYLIGYVHY